MDNTFKLLIKVVGYKIWFNITTDIKGQISSNCFYSVEFSSINSLFTCDLKNTSSTISIYYDFTKSQIYYKTYGIQEPYIINKVKTEYIYSEDENIGKKLENTHQISDKINKKGYKEEKKFSEYFNN